MIEGLPTAGPDVVREIGCENPVLLLRQDVAGHRSRGFCVGAGADGCRVHPCPTWDDALKQERGGSFGGFQRDDEMRIGGVKVVQHEAETAPEAYQLAAKAREPGSEHFVLFKVEHPPFDISAYVMGGVAQFRGSPAR